MTTTLNPPKTKSSGIAGGETKFSPVLRDVRPKVGVEEFLSIAERFGFNPQAMERLAAAVSDSDLPEGGPHLGRYYGSPKPIKGEQFEELALKAFGVKYALAVSSGTAALHCAMVGAGAGPGTEVICAATGFIATALAGGLAGATPVFCDVDESLQMNPALIEKLITSRTVAIAPTHHWGSVCDMDPILEIARKHGLKVIEDCAQSPGATYKGRPVGSLGDFGCFSISSYKIIGGGEGGMVVTNDERSFDRVRQMAEGGGLWRPDRCAPERYEGELFVGGNFRLSELESAVNVIQIRKLPEVLARHREVWRTIRARLGSYKEITWQRSNDPEGDIGYMFRFFPANEELGRKLSEALAATGISAGYRGQTARPDWHVQRHMFPLFRAFPELNRDDLCPVGSDLFDRRITIELNQWWSPETCGQFAACLNSVLSEHCTRINT